MSITLLAHTFSGGPVNATTTSGIDTTGATLLVAIGVGGDNPYAGTMSDSKGNTWIHASTSNNGGTCNLYYCNPSSVGSGHTFTITFNGGFPSIAVAAFSGVLPSSPLDQIHDATRSGTPNSPGSVTPTQNNELVISGVMTNGSGTPSVSGGSLAVTDSQGLVGSTSYGVGLAYVVQTSAASVTPSWTSTGSTVVSTLVASFKALTTTTQNQTGVARITATNVAKTHTGKSRVTVTATKDQSGHADIRNTTPQDQLGKAYVSIPAFQTLTGKANIFTGATQDQHGLARVTATNIVQTLTGISRLATEATKAQTGLARVTMTTSKTQSGVGNIFNTTTRTQAGLARFTKANILQTQSGTANIRGTTARAQSGKGSITNSVLKTISGKGRVAPPLYPWRIKEHQLTTSQFANRVTVLGAFTGTDGAELRSTADDTASQTALGRIVSAIIVNRQIDNQPALDLAASIALEQRAQLETITFEFDSDSQLPNTPQGLQVGLLVTINSVGANIDGSFVVQTLKLSQVTPTRTLYNVTCGNYQGSLAERLRQLDRITNGPVLQPAVPPPPDSITSAQLQDGAVTTLKIAAEAVTDAQLAVAAVTADILAAGAVTNTKIADNAISTPKVQAGAITSVSLAASSVVAGKIAASSIVGTNIQAGSITAANAVFASGTIQAADIANATITAAQIANATITAAQIANATITNAQIASLNADKITTGTLNASLIATGAIQGTQLADGTITAVKIASINASTITTGTLSAGVIAAGSITGTKLANGTVTATQIASATITSAQIASATITGANIASATITDANIGSLSASKISAGTISASISITSPTITSTSGSNSLSLSSAQITIQGSTARTVISQGQISCTLISNSERTFISGQTLSQSNIFGSTILFHDGFGSGNSGRLVLLDGSGNNKCSMDVNGYAFGSVIVVNSSGTFTGAGVDCKSNGIGGLGFNAWNGSSYAFGITQNVTISGTTLHFQGGILYQVT